MDFDQEQAPPRAYVSGPAQIRMVEHGPVRVALEVTRQTENSKFVQTIRLSAGDAGNRVEFGNAIDWRTLAANLKVAFPLSAANEDATYNWDVGTIERPNAQERQFEVASHRWIDLTDKSGSFGATILTEFKNGSDKPNDNTIRLDASALARNAACHQWTSAGVHRPGKPGLGPSRILIRLGGTRRRLANKRRRIGRLTVLAIRSSPSKRQNIPGRWARPFPCFTSTTPEFVCSLSRKRKQMTKSFSAWSSSTAIQRKMCASPSPGLSSPPARSMPRNNRSKQEPASLNSGALVTSFTAYQPRTYALRLGPPTAKLAAIRSQPVALKYDLAVASNDDTRTEGGGFDGKGNAMPAEMLPTAIAYHGVEFKLAPAKTGMPDAVVAKGQAIPLPSGHYNRVYILAASADGDQTAAFRVGAKTANLNIEDWGGFIGQWDTRIFRNQDDRNWAISAHHAPWPPG